MGDFVSARSTSALFTWAARTVTIVHASSIWSVKYVLELSVVALGPAMGATYGIDELCRNADTVAFAANAALQDIPYAKFTPDLANIDRPCPCTERLSCGR